MSVTLTFMVPVVCADAADVEIAPGPGAAEPESPSQWYGEGVRPTEARTPEEERDGFHLPDGFQVELFASEPQIAKPLNMAFDIRGRLWVTNTIEYPYPAPADREPRDSIKVLEDTDGDHRADRVTLFADKLNVPMGLIPYGDGVIAFSIPNLYYLRDTDADGVCDQREVILGPFDTKRDTHGMVSSLRYGYDGWIYACHGFNNQSQVAGADGWKIEMTSGNTFRFRPDGSRVEHMTHGQVNPFGMTCDAWGNWFSADCHSKPITQLIRGAYYSSFGRPDDGLGLVPSMMEHTHGSTAISGLVMYDAENFPANYQNQFYSGNVMTSRINRNAISKIGATLRATELPDFLTSDDPWFRPVDLQIAPDGSLYVADFYNRIIGHYEVPLDHPGRDRDRGRIWRISSTEQNHRAEKTTSPQVAESCTPTNTSLQLRQLHHRVASGASDTASDHGPTDERCSDSRLELWFQFRCDRLTDEQWLVAASDSDAIVRTHAMIVAGECLAWSPQVRDTVFEHLDDTEPFVVRAAAEACGRHPSEAAIALLLDRLHQVDPEDVMLRQSIRIAIRDSLLDPTVAAHINGASLLAGDDFEEFSKILLGTHSEAAGRWLAKSLVRNKRAASEQMPLIRHAIATLPDSEIDGLVAGLRRSIEIDDNSRKELLQAIVDAGGSKSDEARAWALDWCREQWNRHIEPLAKESSPRLQWHRSDASGHWPLESRKSSQGTDRDYHSTFKLGEAFVGTIRSDSFPLPATMTFEIVGHDGVPSEPIKDTTELRLVDASTGAILRREPPPRSDIARQVTWDLAELVGQDAYIEVFDNNSDGSYAWIAFGHFDDARLADDPLGETIRQWFEVAGRYQLDELVPTMASLLDQYPTMDPSSRLELLGGIAKLQQSNTSLAMVDTLKMLPRAGNVLPELESSILQGLTDTTDLSWLKTCTTGLTRAAQQSLAKSLAQRRESLPWLVTAANQGWIAGDVLRLKEVESSIAAMASDALKTKVAETLATLPDENVELVRAASETLQQFTNRGGDAVAGAMVFQKHCAACHQIGGSGAIVGPQLDGIGARGAERLLEDMFLPDRNVDSAFRATSLVLDDGTVAMGLIRNETATTIEIVDNTGKAKSIDSDAVELRQTTTRSLMPSGLHEAIGDPGIHDLLAYLLSQRAMAKP